MPSYTSKNKTDSIAILASHQFRQNILHDPSRRPDLHFSTTTYPLGLCRTPSLSHPHQ